MSDVVIHIGRFRWWQRIYLAWHCLFAERLRFGRAKVEPAPTVK